MYKSLLQPILFRLDPEQAHDLLFSILPFAQNSLVCGVVNSLFEREDSRLNIEIAGLKFRNPVGLAAGFDKNCIAPRFLSSLGFGHVEIGTITAKPQAGNDRPRIFRFPRDEALINRMGFPSQGVDAVLSRLKRVKSVTPRGVFGANIGKSKVTPLEDALEDYLYTFERVKDFVDYVALNVSSPNTPELRKLQEPQKLKDLFNGIKERNQSGIPIFIKIAPDLTTSEIDSILDVAVSTGASGIIATNTTVSRDGLTVATNETGGMSGRPLTEKSIAIVSYLYQRLQGALPIIGVGGIFSGKDALRMIQAGASAVQIYTALVFEGPAVVSRINRELLECLHLIGVGSVSEVVGKSK